MGIPKNTKASTRKAPKRRKVGKRGPTGKKGGPVKRGDPTRRKQPAPAPRRTHAAHAKPVPLLDDAAGTDIGPGPDPEVDRMAGEGGVSPDLADPPIGGSAVGKTDGRGNVVD